MRLYKYNGRELPSVTTITDQLDKPPLKQWAANCACDYVIRQVENADADMVSVPALYSAIESARHNWRKVSSHALDVGSRVHDAIEHFFMTGEEPQSPAKEVEQAWTAFLDWYTSHNIKAIDIEKTVYGKDYAGTMDFFGQFDGKLYVIDWKSSKGVWDEMRWQVAGYRFALEQGLQEPQGCGILRLDKATGRPEWVDTSETYGQDLAIFLALRDLWYLRNPKYKEEGNE